MVNAAVSTLLDLEFDVQPKVVEHFLRTQVGVRPGGTEVGLRRRVHEYAVLRAPAVDLVRFMGPPASQILSVEQRDGMAETHRAKVRRSRWHRRNLLARERVASHRSVLRRNHEDSLQPAVFDSRLHRFFYGSFPVSPERELDPTI